MSPGLIQLCGLPRGYLHARAALGSPQGSRGRWVPTQGWGVGGGGLALFSFLLPTQHRDTVLGNRVMVPMPTLS